MSVNVGSAVYVCILHHPPRSGHYGDQGDDEVMGVVQVEEDAEWWVSQDPDHRRYEERTLGQVSSYGQV